MLSLRAIVAALLLAVSPAGAAASSPKELVWGFSEYPPFKFKEKGEHRGIDVALMRKLAEKLGLKLTVVECPLRRCIELLKDGNVDMLTAFGLRPDREEFTHFVNPPYNTDNYKAFYTKKGSDVRIERFEDLHKYKIGVKNGARYFPQFDDDPKIKKEIVYEVRQNLDKLEHGRVDAVVNTEIEFDYLIAVHGFDGRFDKQPYKGEAGRDFIGLSKKSPLYPRKDEIEAIVKEIVQSGAIKRIVDELFDMVRKERQAAEAAGTAKKPTLSGPGTTAK